MRLLKKQLGESSMQVDSEFSSQAKEWPKAKRGGPKWKHSCMSDSCNNILAYFFD